MIRVPGRGRYRGKEEVLTYAQRGDVLADHLQHNSERYNLYGASCFSAQYQRPCTVPKQSSLPQLVFPELR